MQILLKHELKENQIKYTIVLIDLPCSENHELNDKYFGWLWSNRFQEEIDSNF